MVKIRLMREGFPAKIPHIIKLLSLKPVLLHCRSVEQDRRRKTDPCLCNYLSYNKVGIWNQWGRDELFNKRCWDGCLFGKKRQIRFPFHIRYQEITGDTTILSFILNC